MKANPKKHYLISSLPQKESARLDQYLISLYPQTSRLYWRKFIGELVLLNGKRVKKGSLLKEEDQLVVDEEKLNRFLKLEEDIIQAPPIQVICESPDFIAVNKKSGLSVYPLHPLERDTLIQHLFPLYPELKDLGPELEYGLLHRLDYETSGLVLVARHPSAYHYFRNCFKERKIEKYYQAIVENTLEGRGEIKFPLIHHPKNTKKMKVLELQESGDGGKKLGKVLGDGGDFLQDGVKLSSAQKAITLYEASPIGHNLSRVKIQIITGVRHQIRVHLAFIGHPIVGDTLYGASGILRKKYGRILLHAERLKFQDPQAKEWLIECPIPQEFRYSN